MFRLPATAKTLKKGPSLPMMGLVAISTILSIFILGCERPIEELDPYGTTTPEIREDVPNTSVSVVQGEDYSLPEWAQPEPFAGYVGSSLSLPRPEGSTPIVHWWTNWAELEPERGQYNWDLVENRFAEAAAGGYQLNMHLQSITYGGGSESMGIVVGQSVPDWVLVDFELSEEEIINLGWEFDLLIIPGWRQEIREAFNNLIKAFGEQGFPQSPQLASTYIMGISPSRGEEFWMSQTALNILERDHGFSVSVLEDWMTSRFAAYAEAFGSEIHKVAWVGKQGSWRYIGDGRYEDLALQLVQDAWDMGAGNRSSGIEYYHQWLNEPALGQDIDDNGYLFNDESLPPLNSERYYGDENEEYGDQWIGRFGSRVGEAQRYRFSLLRALQMRMRFLWTSNDAETVNPPLSSYVAMNLGKTVENSPDAWAYLKESPVSTHHSPVGLVRNFERWLLQRDLPGGMTVPAQRTFREFNAGGNHGSGPDQWYDDVARRTDLASGNPSIFFDLDDRFQVNGPLQIKVEIFDDSLASWHIEYINSQHVLTSTDAFTNQGDGAVKTVSFTINQASFLNGLDNGMDFRIVCDGPEDVTVRWVRLVRLESP